MALNVVYLSSAQRNINPPCSLDEFLQAVFGAADWQLAHVAGITDGKGWTGRSWRDWTPAERAALPGQNAYFAISRVKGGHRRIENFVACYAVVCDDVGTTIKEPAVLALLGPPSWRIETSAGNEQWGYILRVPETNPNKITALLKGMIAHKLTDPKTDAVHYFRLPEGTNTKPTRNNYRHVLLEWRPDRTFDVDDLLALVGVDATGVPPPGPGQSRACYRTPDELANGDTLVRKLHEWGLLDGTRTESINGGPGWHFAVCPLVHGSAPVADGRTAVFFNHAFNCPHGTCASATDSFAFIRWFRERLSEDTFGLFSHEAALDFEPVDHPESIKAFSLFGDAQSRTGRGGLGDPWRKPEPPLWCGAVFPPAFEAEMAKLAAQNGMDLGALGVCFMLAASGAADKRARLAPFAGVPWAVPPVLWAMLIGHSGNLKSPMMNLALRRLVEAHKSNMARYQRALRTWNSKTKADKAAEPKPEPVALVVKNSTVESLQVLLSNNERGLIETRDELAGKFDFGRYSSGGQGDAERAFLMEAYEGEYHDVFRMSRTTYAESSALTLLGGIQPDRLGDFKGLDKDGFIQRFISCVLRDARVPDPTAVPDLTILDGAIDRLLTLTPIDEYETDAGGEALIRETWERGKLLSAGPFLTAGFRGFTSKLHGTHARAALILHLMDGGQGVVIPRDTVMRAARFTDFVQRHAQTFYFGLDGTAEAIAQSIASYLLRYPTPKLTTRLLKRNVRPCVKMTTKDMQIAVEPLIHDGWLEPESGFPNNKAWVVNPEIKEFSPERMASEIERNETVKNAMNPTRA